MLLWNFAAHLLAYSYFPQEGIGPSATIQNSLQKLYTCKSDSLHLLCGRRTRRLAWRTHWRA